MRAAAALAATVLLAALLRPAPLHAQVTRREVIRVDTMRARQDTLRRDTTGADSLRVGRGSGLPQRPSREFQAPDSVTQALLRLRGFTITRYSADSVQLLADEKEIRLRGRGLVEREGSTLEADGIRYVESGCQLLADGQPRLFDPTGVLVGEGMTYDACNKTGIVERARTDLPHGGGTWYLIGDMAVDNAEDRVYAAGATITSCELEEPHYHFATRQVKWVNKRLMVSRPAVLYVADVPVAWMPFMFQDTRRGRRSGLLPPRVGINDIVRFNSGYRRQVTDVGYYLAISDYMDAQTSLDWYSGRSLTVNGRLRYRWLDRFMAGGLAVSRLWQFQEQRSSLRLSWSHQQQFSLASQLTANIDYATSSRIIARNAVDPVLAIGTIDSRLNYQRRFSWGSLNVGGSRNQQLDKPQVTLAFPTIAFTPNPIAVSRSVTWSPTLNFSSTLTTGVAGGGTVRLAPGRTDTLLVDSRQSSFSLGTPVRIGNWIWQNSFALLDSWSNRRSVPSDTLDTLVTRAEAFETSLDWQTGIGLPVLFQGRWNLQPAVQIVNTAPGAFLIRNEFTGGRFIAQSKRLQFAAGVSPALYGIFPGVGPVSRIRHAITPSVRWAYSPAATIPQDYADALSRGAGTGNRNIPARHTVSMGLTQNIEVKLRPATATSAGADTTRGTDAAAQPAEGRKLKVLSIQSSEIGYDFEQAKQPGRNGWTTQTWGNIVSSDLVRGLSMTLTMDLWEGRVGYDSSRFRPYLTSVATGFSIGTGTLNLLRRVLGLAPGTYRQAADSVPVAPSPMEPGRNFTNAFQRGPLATRSSSLDRLMPARGGGQFNASLNYSLQRQRPTTGSTSAITASNAANSMMTGSLTFSPTPHWTVSWQTSYNFTQGQFADHIVRLDRNLHDWRATFSFIRSANGNFSFSFYIELIDEPDLKFAYDQRSILN
jgi:hypothetical protein